MAAPAWNLQWRSSRFKPSEYRVTEPAQQRLNHFPKSGAITRKDHLLRQLRRMRATHGGVYAFFPDAFMMPSEYVRASML